jgi:hypothetical protein
MPFHDGYFSFIDRCGEFLSVVLSRNNKMKPARHSREARSRRLPQADLLLKQLALDIDILGPLELSSVHKTMGISKVSGPPVSVSVCVCNHQLLRTLAAFTFYGKHYICWTGWNAAQQQFGSFISAAK